MIDLYEAKTIGGRLATVNIDNNEIEAGGSIIHPKNMYMQKFVKLMGKCGLFFFRRNLITKCLHKEYY